MLGSKIFDLKRLILCSPEFLIGLLLFYLFKDNSELFAKITVAIKGDSNIPDVVSLLPFSFVAVSYRLGMGVIRPGNEEENKILYEWPKYWMLEYRFYASLITCVICSIAIVWFYLNPDQLSDEVLGVIFVGSISISSMTIFLLAAAKITIRKIFTLHL